jgi:hypothetical protein
MIEVVSLAITQHRICQRGRVYVLDLSILRIASMWLRMDVLELWYLESHFPFRTIRPILVPPCLA